MALKPHSYNNPQPSKPAGNSPHGGLKLHQYAAPATTTPDSNWKPEPAKPVVQPVRKTPVLDAIAKVIEPPAPEVQGVMKRMPSEIARHLPLGVGEAIKQIQDDTETAASITLKDVLKEVPSQTLEAAKQFIKAPLSYGLTFYGLGSTLAKHMGLGNSPAADDSGAVKLNIPFLGETTNLQQRVKDYVDQNGDYGHDPLGMLQQGVDVAAWTGEELMNGLFLASLLKVPFAPRPQAITGEVKAKATSPMPVTTPPKSGRLYQENAVTTVGDAATFKKIATENKIEVSKKYNPSNPVYFRATVDKNGIGTGKFFQVRPSYFDTFLNKLQKNPAKVPEPQLLPIATATKDITTMSSRAADKPTIVPPASVVAPHEGGVVPAPESGVVPAPNGAVAPAAPTSVTTTAPATGITPANSNIPAETPPREVTATAETKPTVPQVTNFGQARTVLTTALRNTDKTNVERNNSLAIVRDWAQEQLALVSSPEAKASFQRLVDMANRGLSGSNATGNGVNSTVTPPAPETPPLSLPKAGKELGTPKQPAKEDAPKALVGRTFEATETDSSGKTETHTITIRNVDGARIIYTRSGGATGEGEYFANWHYFKAQMEAGKFVETSESVTTQAEKVKKAVRDEAKSIKQVAKETGIKEPNVRRIFGVGAKKGTFKRLDKGVYVLEVDGKEYAYIEAGDAMEVLPRLVKEGKKFDEIGFDIPYKAAGNRGGNRMNEAEGTIYGLLDLPDWQKKIVPHIIPLLRTPDSPVFFMFAQSKSSLPKMQQYIKAMLDAGLKPVAKADYHKLTKEGKGHKFGKHDLAPEGILFLSQSGKINWNETPQLDFKLVRPTGYQTEKPEALIRKFITMSTKEGDIVLDPFAGSGVTGAAAIKTGRRVHLVEKNPDVVEHIIKPRIEKALGGDIFDENGKLRLEGGKEMSKSQLKKAGFGVEAMGFGESADTVDINGKPAIAFHWHGRALDGFSVAKDFRLQGVGEAFIREILNDNGGTLRVEDPNDAMLAVLRKVGDVSEKDGTGGVIVTSKTGEKSPSPDRTPPAPQESSANTPDKSSTDSILELASKTTLGGEVQKYKSAAEFAVAMKERLGKVGFGDAPSIDVTLNQEFIELAQKPVFQKIYKDGGNDIGVLGAMWEILKRGKGVTKVPLKKSDLAAIYKTTAEFRTHPILKVDANKNLTFNGRTTQFKIKASALGLDAERLQEGDRIKYNPKNFENASKEIRVLKKETGKEVTVYASYDEKPTQHDKDLAETLRGTKGMTAKDIVAKYPDIQLIRDVPAKDVHGKKVVIPAGESLTPYELKGNKILLQDGETYVVSKSQYENIKNNSEVDEHKSSPYPERQGLTDVVLGHGTGVSEKDVVWHMTSKDGEPKVYNGTVGNRTFVIQQEDEHWYVGEVGGLLGHTTNTYTEAVEAVDKELKEPTRAKFGSYTLPNGKNYREILITAPAVKAPELPEPPETITELPDDYEYTRNMNVAQTWSVTPKAQRHGRPFAGMHETKQGARLAAIEKLNNEQSEKYKARVRVLSANHNFTGSHWEQKNIIASLRVNERDYNGEKVDFMEETQSDWALAGRRHGFQGEKANPPIEAREKLREMGYTFETDMGNDLILYKDDEIAEYDELPADVKTLVDTYIGDGENAEEIANMERSVPNHPKLKDWVRTAVKTFLKNAVEGKADRIAWITGEQTSARYNLATHVSNVKWGNDRGMFDIAEGAEKTIIIDAKGRRGRMEIGINDKGTIVSVEDGSPIDWKGKGLNEVLGKGLADKIMEHNTGELSGEGLAFGGEWAKHLYDEQVKNIVEEVTGAKVEYIDMGLPVKSGLDAFTVEGAPLTAENMKVGQTIVRLNGGQPEGGAPYVISEVIGDGKFKAVPRHITVGTHAASRGDARFDSNETTFDIKPRTSLQPSVRITDAVKRKVKGQAPDIKKPSGKLLNDAPAGGANLNVGGFREDTPLSPRGSEKLSPIELPELVDIARALMGAVPKIRQIVSKKFGGGASGAFFPRGAGEIRLRADLFDPAIAGIQQVVKTLAHEIGHLADYLPEGTMSRGNLMGRLMTLKKFQSDFFAEAGRSRTNEALRDQMYKLSVYWRPYDEALASPQFIQYRKSAPEIYADFISALFNDPELTARMAPEAYNLFFEHLDRKPAVRDAYFQAQSLLSGDRSTLVAARRAGVQQMFKEGDYKAIDLQNQKVAERAKRENNLFFKLKFEAIDKNYAVIDRVKALEKQGKVIPPDEDPRYALEERAYLGGKIKAIFETDFNPIYQDLKNAGIAWGDFGEALFYQRIIAGDRSTQANPRGITPDAAQELLDALKSDYSEEQQAILMNATNRFRTGLKKVAEEAYEEGLYSPELYQKMQENPAYATFQVIDHLEDGVSAKVFKSIGTFKDITNPADASLLKLVATVRAIERNKVHRLTIDFLKEHYADEISPAKAMFTGKGKRFIESKKDNESLVMMMRGGKQEGYYVDPYIQKSLANESIGHSLAMVSGLRMMNSYVFRPLFIGFNLGFQAFNFVRDFSRAWKVIPDMTIWRMMQRYKQAYPLARTRAFGGKDAGEKWIQAAKDLQKLEHDQVFSVTFNDIIMGETAEEVQIERIMRTSGIESFQPKNPNKFIKPFAKFLDGIKRIGDLIETLPKAAGFYEITDKAPLTKADASFIRRYIGSPDFLAGGHLKPVTNELFLFSNAIAQGIRSDLAIATNPKTRGAYWYKTMKVNILPKILMFLAGLGLFGAAVKKAMDDASEYDKTNYNVIPLGTDTDGKTIYFRMPQDESGRLIGALAWKALSSWTNRTPWTADLAQIASLSAGQLPNISPTIPAAKAMFDYLSGQNPYDAFKNRNVLTDDVFAAGGMRAHKAFLGWEFNQLGGGIIQRFYAENGQPPATEGTVSKFVNLPVISNILGRFIRVTNYGTTEQLAAIKKETQAIEAEARLDKKAVINKYVELAQQNPSKKAQYEQQLAREQFAGTTPTTAQRKALISSFRLALLKGSSPAEVQALVSANTNVEKAAILKELKGKMTAGEYKNLLNKAQQEGVISAKFRTTVN